MQMDINTGKLLSKEDSYSQSINLILKTQKSERILNRKFGSNAGFYLGHPVNSVVIDLSAEVIASLQENDNRISVDNVSVQNNNNIGLIININYNGSENTNVELT